jgi:hypothetical protein
MNGDVQKDPFALPAPHPVETDLEDPWFSRRPSRRPSLRPIPASWVPRAPTPVELTDDDPVASRWFR